MSIHRLVLTSGLNDVDSGLPNNLLCFCQGGCQSAVATFQNQHNTALTLTNIIIAYAGTGVTVTPTHINNVPISYPFTVFQNQSINITFQICWNTSPINDWSLTFVTAEHNNDREYEFSTTCTSTTFMWDSTSVPFGSIPADSTIQVVRNFTNTSVAPVTISMNFAGCSFNLQQVPSSTTIQPGQTVPITFEWNPQFDGETLNCFVFDSVCNTQLNFTGVATAPLINHFDIIGGGLDPDGVNYLDCCQPCQGTTIEFQNNHDTPLTLDDFLIDTTGSGVNVSFVGFSGQPPSWPVLNVGDTVVFEFQVCWDGVTNPLSSWSFTLITLEHGNDPPYTFDMECVDLHSLFSTYTFDFTNAILNATNSQSITFNNITIGLITINLDPSVCGVNLIQSPSPAVIPSGTVGTVTLNWTPIDQSETLSCTISNYCGLDFDVTGSVFEEPCECLCCLDIEIQTEGNYLQPQNGFCESDVLYSTASFLEQKTVVFKMKYQTGLITGWNIQFNPALFTFDCTAPFDGTNNFPVRYYFQYLSAQHLDGTAYSMNLLGVTSNAMNLKNWKVNFRPINAVNGTFNIEFTFYLIQDYEDFITNLTWFNSTKLKRTTLSETTDFLNLLPSVYYNKEKFIQGAFLMTDPGTIVNDSPFKCLTYTCSNFAARFYNVGLGNGYAEFLNPVFTLSRNNIPVNDFSVFSNTKVQFSIEVPAIYGTQRPILIYHLFNASIEDNSVDFFTSSDSSRCRVLNYPGTGVVDNHLIRPGAFGTSGSNWIFSLHVDSNLDPASTYRVAAIVYGSNGDMVNTFLSQEIRVTQFPDMDCDCYPEINSTFLQYWRQHDVECFQPVAKERIGHRINLSSGDFPSCMYDLGVEITNWRQQLVSVQLNIYKKKDNFPANNKTTFFQYETHKSIRNNAFFGGFENLNDLVLADTGANDIIVAINNRRVHWENNLFNGGQVLVANNNTFMNRVPAGFLSSGYISTNFILDSWINQDVYFEYIFTFDLSPQVGQPYNWNIVKAFKVNAIDFEPINSGFDQVITDVIIEGKDPITDVFLPIQEPICFSKYSEIKLTYQADREGNFIFFMEKEPFGLPTLLENNEALSPSSMVQLDNPAVVSMDTSFDAVNYQASVVLNPNFLEDARYRFCGYISFPDAAAVCEYFLYHAEVGGSGITMPSPITGNTIPLTFNNAIINRYIYIRSSTGDTPYPVPGQTYVLEYSFTNPTTRIVQIFFGQWAFSGIPQVTLPIGSTSGTVSFVWGAGTSGEWSVRITTGTDMTTIGSFKIGNALCP